MRLPEDEPECDPAYDREERECPDCGGTGDYPDGTRTQPCGYCSGTGVVEVLT